MNDLMEKDTLIYFRSDEGIIGLNLKAKTKFSRPEPIMWFHDRDEILTRAAFASIPVKIKRETNYGSEDTCVIKLKELTSPCLCSSVSNEYITIITVNTDPAHKATYKLHLFETNGADRGMYYSYFA